MNLPISFQERIMNCFHEEGKDWLLTLEARVDEIAGKWNLTLGGPVTNLSYNYVLNVIDDKTGHTYILKMGLPGEDFENEVNALQLYNGVGCAQLIKADVNNGAMLLERLQPGTMLSEQRDEVLAIQHFCRVWKKIRRPFPEDHTFPIITDWANTFTNYCDTPFSEGNIPHEWVRTAEAYVHEIIASSDEIELLHGDLHHENILYSEQRGWLAIDPKGVGGDPCFDVIPFMVNHLFTKQDPENVLKLRIDILCDELNLNREKLLKAAIVMSTLKACWSIEENGPYWKEMYQCAKWFEELLIAEMGGLQNE